MHRSDASGSEVKTHSVGDSLNKSSSKKLETDTFRPEFMFDIRALRAGQPHISGKRKGLEFD